MSAIRRFFGRRSRKRSIGCSMATSGELNKQLYDAVERNDIVAVIALLERGADVNSWGAHGYLLGGSNSTVLMEATFNGNKVLVDLLLCRGAAVNETGIGRYTALIFAAAGGHEEIVDLLLQNNADVDKKGRFGFTAIHCAAIDNHPSIINRLVSCGATIDIDDDEGKTPLWLAAVYDYVNCVDVLLSVGANPHHRSNSDGSPLDIAKKEGHDEVVKRLNDAGECRVLSLQFQVKRFMLKRYNRSQMMSFPLPTRLKEWLTEHLR